jgi:hypothetical protein
MPSTPDANISPPGVDSAISDDAPIVSTSDARVATPLLDADIFVPVNYTPSPSGRSMVPSGVVSSSAHYTVVRTLGQSPGGNRVHESPHYRFIGGLVGATQK